MSDFLLFSTWDPANEDAAGTPGHLAAGAQPFHEQNTMEGSEFMDESLRMTEQPLAPDEADLF
jgi:hypothetical protein